MTEPPKISPDLAVEHDIQRLMLERLGIAWPPGEPFYTVIEVEIERLRQAGLKLAARSSTESVLLQAKVRRLTTLTDQLADTINKRQVEADELRAALNEALAQNERFNTRYRDAEAEVERLRAAYDRDIRAEKREVERLKAEVGRALDEPTQNEHDLYTEVKLLRTALEAMNQALAGHPIYEMSALQRQVQSLLAQS